MAQTIEEIAPLVRLVTAEIVGGQQIFDDAYQEALLRAWQRLEQGHSRQIAIYAAKQAVVTLARGGRPTGSTEGGLGGRTDTHRTATSLTRQTNDGEADEFVFEPADTSALEALEQIEARVTLAGALAGLTDEQRDLVVDVFWGQRLIKDIAAERGVSPQAISSRLQKKILPALRRSLEAA